MKKLILTLILGQFYLFSTAQIIVADHTVVDQYDKIPQEWIDKVEKIWVAMVGASHGSNYVNGGQLLEDLNSKFQFNKQTYGTPSKSLTNGLRFNAAHWGTRESTTGWSWYDVADDFWTNDAAISQVKTSLSYSNQGGWTLFGFMYGWSYEVSQKEPTGQYDPVYHVRWAGKTEAGIDGSENWGLDAGDVSLTGNRVTMQNYIDAMHEFEDYIADNNLGTKMIWTTGPVDTDAGNLAIDEVGYQAYLKWEHIRNYVGGLSGTHYLLDYADILTYNDAGVQSTTTWRDNNGTLQTFPIISPENEQVPIEAHIGDAGKLKLAKASWWLFARMLGWDGTPTAINDLNLDKDFTLVLNGDDLSLKFEDNYIGSTVSLYDTSGRVLDKKKVLSNSCRFNIGQLSKGVYLLVLSDGKSGSTKFVKFK
ncbi:T9SS type A sorting domain-containing protein [Carboxylicivirga sp. N1Y90]|uniref:T9SS type A sorting domain-containing protein n=1 Tax=Carboxylicivirga fragile TaxID=3417571 RepID=UPI003D354129|nr:T9SS type A sorting domain-containing protein [Marinilabiliaceae bacterium N1Y90]